MCCFVPVPVFDLRISAYCAQAGHTANDVFHINTRGEFHCGRVCGTGAALPGRPLSRVTSEPTGIHDSNMELIRVHMALHAGLQGRWPNPLLGARIWRLIRWPLFTVCVCRMC